MNLFAFTGPAPPPDHEPTIDMLKYHLRNAPLVGAAAYLAVILALQRSQSRRCPSWPIHCNKCPARHLGSSTLACEVGFDAAAQAGAAASPACRRCERLLRFLLAAAPPMSARARRVTQWYATSVPIESQTSAMTCG